MEIEDLKTKLKEIINKQQNDNINYDEVQGHMDAEKALLAYINDKGVSRLFYKIDKWYE